MKAKAVYNPGFTPENKENWDLALKSGNTPLQIWLDKKVQPIYRNTALMLVTAPAAALTEPYLTASPYSKSVDINMYYRGPVKTPNPVELQCIWSDNQLKDEYARAILWWLENGYVDMVSDTDEAVSFRWAIENILKGPSTNITVSDKLFGFHPINQLDIVLDKPNGYPSIYCDELVFDPKIPEKYRVETVNLMIECAKRQEAAIPQHGKNIFRRPKHDVAARLRDIISADHLECRYDEIPEDQAEKILLPIVEFLTSSYILMSVDNLVSICTKPLPEDVVSRFVAGALKTNYSFRKSLVPMSNCFLDRAISVHEWLRAHPEIQLLDQAVVERSLRYCQEKRGELKARIKEAQNQEGQRRKALEKLHI